MPVTEAVLDNGLTVLIRESRAAPVVSCWAGYRVGARNERPGITGASHWVEHMTFKGTARLGKGDIFRLTARHGGANNGFTTDDFTLYYETLPAAQLPVALMIEAERMAHALFDPEETERERTVILSERQGSENSPHYLLAEKMGEAVFQVHPYRAPIIGSRADLERLTRDELLAHYRTYYAPNNAWLAIVGDVDPEEALEEVRVHFGEIPPGPPVPPVTAQEPPQAEERRVELRQPGGAAHLSIAYHTPASGHPDWYPLAMVDAVLSGGKAVSWGGGGYMGRSARVYRALVETRLAANASTSFRLSLDPYVFSASLTLREGVEPAAAEAALARAVEEVATRPPSAAEMERALRQVEAQSAYGRDGVTSQAFSLAFFQGLGEWSAMDRHVERMRAVT
ncbi:MAG TPA: pitrilysin family protein, partial [Armatimonadota bacterium]|nr:pitrilysin family protein [Armatimonadota bacterium]